MGGPTKAHLEEGAEAIPMLRVSKRKIDDCLKISCLRAAIISLSGVRHRNHMTFGRARIQGICEDQFATNAGLEVFQ